MRTRSSHTLLTLAAVALMSAAAGAQAAKAPPAKTPPAKPPVQKAQTAQTVAAASIDPGMTKAQVTERFGKPASERSRGEYTYLFYSNGMEKKVGMSDIVTLQNDHVIDAVLRSPKRSYSGNSTSPKAISSKDAAHAKGTPPLKVGGRGA